MCVLELRSYTDCRDDQGEVTTHVRPYFRPCSSPYCNENQYCFTPAATDTVETAYALACPTCYGTSFHPPEEAKSRPDSWTITSPGGEACDNYAAILARLLWLALKMNIPSTSSGGSQAERNEILRQRDLYTLDAIGRAIAEWGCKVCGKNQFQEDENKVFGCDCITNSNAHHYRWNPAVELRRRIASDILRDNQSHPVRPRWMPELDEHGNFQPGFCPSIRETIVEERRGITLPPPPVIGGVTRPTLVIPPPFTADAIARRTSHLIERNNARVGFWVNNLVTARGWNIDRLPEGVRNHFYSEARRAPLLPLHKTILQILVLDSGLSLERASAIFARFGQLNAPTILEILGEMDPMNPPPEAPWTAPHSPERNPEGEVARLRQTVERLRIYERDAYPGRPDNDPPPSLMQMLELRLGDTTVGIDELVHTRRVMHAQWLERETNQYNLALEAQTACSVGQINRMIARREGVQREEDLEGCPNCGKPWFYLIEDNAQPRFPVGSKYCTRDDRGDLQHLMCVPCFRGTARGANSEEDVECPVCNTPYRLPQDDPGAVISMADVD